MTDLMRRLIASALADEVPCLVASVSADGRPQISPKGSVAVFDDEHLSYWERSYRTSFSRITENPHVVVYYRNPHRSPEMPWRAGALRFHGTAQITDDGAKRDRAYELAHPNEQKRDPDKKGVGVLIRVDLIEELDGKVVMQRDA